MGYWTDYSKTFVHPRSLFQLPGVWQGQGSFGAFGEGKGLFGVSETRDDIMDRVRYWAEECDTFQVNLHSDLCPSARLIHVSVPLHLCTFAECLLPPDSADVLSSESKIFPCLS